MIEPDGEGLVQFVGQTAHDLAQPAWSPNGGTIAAYAYDMANQTARIDFYDANSGQRLYYVWMVTPLDPQSPTWLDDDWIAVTTPARVGSGTRTVALLRLSAPTWVVPLGTSHEPVVHVTVAPR
jgi:hypothetical protein